MLKFKCKIKKTTDKDKKEFLKGLCIVLLGIIVYVYFRGEYER